MTNFNVLITLLYIADILNQISKKKIEDHY